MQVGIQDMDTSMLVIIFLILMVVVILVKNLKGILLKLKGFKKRGLKLRKTSLESSRNIFLDDVYERYETIIKTIYDLSREESETDTDLLEKLRSQQDFSLETLAEIEAFLCKYHGARFGNKNNAELDNIIKSLEKGIGSSRKQMI